MEETDLHLYRFKSYLTWPCYWNTNNVIRYVVCNELNVISYYLLCYMILWVLLACFHLKCFLAEPNCPSQYSFKSSRANYDLFVWLCLVTVLNGKFNSSECCCVNFVNFIYSVTQPSWQLKGKPLVNLCEGCVWLLKVVTSY